MTTAVLSNSAKQYVDGVFTKLQAKNAHQPEFLQAAEEIFLSLVLFQFSTFRIATSNFLF